MFKMRWWRPPLSLAGLIALSAWQSRGLLGGAILGVVAGLSARFFATASLGQDARVMIDLLLAITTIGSLAIGWLIATNLAAAEQERGAGLLLASKPLTAGQYAVGRWLGIVVGSALIYIISALVGCLIASLGQQMPLAELSLSWLTSGGELLVLAALANLLACWTTSSLASFLTLALWFIGHSIDVLVMSSGWQFLGYILPNLNRFNLHETYVTATGLPGTFYVLTGVYALSWSVVLVVLASAALKKRTW